MELLGASDDDGDIMDLDGCSSADDGASDLESLPDESLKTIAPRPSALAPQRPTPTALSAGPGLGLPAGAGGVRPASGAHGASGMARSASGEQPLGAVNEPRPNFAFGGAAHGAQQPSLAQPGAAAFGGTRARGDLDASGPTDAARSAALALSMRSDLDDDDDDDDDDGYDDDFDDEEFERDDGDGDGDGGDGDGGDDGGDSQRGFSDDDDEPLGARTAHGGQHSPTRQPAGGSATDLRASLGLGGGGQPAARAGRRAAGGAGAGGGDGDRRDDGGLRGFEQVRYGSEAEARAVRAAREAEEEALEAEAMMGERSDEETAGGSAARDGRRARGASQLHQRNWDGWTADMAAALEAESPHAHARAPPQRGRAPGGNGGSGGAPAAGSARAGAPRPPAAAASASALRPDASRVRAPALARVHSGGGVGGPTSGDEMLALDELKRRNASLKLMIAQAKAAALAAQQRRQAAPGAISKRSSVSAGSASQPPGASESERLERFLSNGRKQLGTQAREHALLRKKLARAYDPNAVQHMSARAQRLQAALEAEVARNRTLQRAVREAERAHARSAAVGGPSAQLRAFNEEVRVLRQRIQAYADGHGDQEKALAAAEETQAALGLQAEQLDAQLKVVRASATYEKAAALRTAARQRLSADRDKLRAELADAEAVEAHGDGDGKRHRRKQQLAVAQLGALHDEIEALVERLGAQDLKLRQQAIALRSQRNALETDARADALASPPTARALLARAPQGATPPTGTTRAQSPSRTAPQTPEFALKPQTHEFAAKPQTPDYAAKPQTPDYAAKPQTPDYADEAFSDDEGLAESLSDSEDAQRRKAFLAQQAGLQPLGGTGLTPQMIAY